MAQRCIETKIGPLYLTADAEGLKSVFWNDRYFSNNPTITSAALQILQHAENQIKDYLDGKRQVFELPLAIDGGSFHQLVWLTINKIPYGKTSSYKDIAHKIFKAKASRAVGTATGRNPLCIVIPCHRVIRVNGFLGGYSGGLAAKKFLLNLEKTRD